MESKPRRVYGDPLNFKSLSRKPVNEHGVIYLFGVLHKSFDLQVESIQSGFPDCIARRRVAEGRWEEVRIEFEYESKSFCAHGHDPDGADIIVCWKHNWSSCPDRIEVIELSSLLRDARALGDDIRAKRKPLSAWQLFAQRHRLAGRSFAEISSLWKDKNRGDAQAD